MYTYRIAGNFRGVLIFVIFVTIPRVTKFSTHEIFHPRIFSRLLRIGLRESRNLKPRKLILKTRDNFSRKFAPPKITRYTVAGLLLTLTEVTQTACTNQVCVWFRPSGKAGKALLSTELDFGEASSTGYQSYCGAILAASALVQEKQTSGLAVEFGEYIDGTRATICNWCNFNATC